MRVMNSIRIKNSFEVFQLPHNSSCPAVSDEVSFSIFFLVLCVNTKKMTDELLSPALVMDSLHWIKYENGAKTFCGTFCSFSAHNCDEAASLNNDANNRASVKSRTSTLRIFYSFTARFCCLQRFVCCQKTMKLQNIKKSITNQSAKV